MTKRGRPKSNEPKKIYPSYYKPKDPHHIEVTRKLHKDRLLAGYQNLHLIVFDEPLRYKESLPIKEMIKRFV
jgi:hypothetical protein